MSLRGCPASQRLDESLDVPLTLGERARIVVQLGTTMLGGALLAVGYLQQRFGSPDLHNIVELIYALAACIVAAPIICGAVRGLFTADPHALTAQLVALATLAAMMTGHFVIAALIPVILNLGHFFEERSVLGAQAAIEGLRKLHARRATLISSEGEREVDPDSLRPGDLLLIRPGDVIPADGEIVEGTAAVDQSPITGESAPEDVQPGDNVYAATINLNGVLRVRVSRIGSDTTMGRVVELLRGAEQSKTPVLKLMEQYAGYYVPIILAVAAVVLFVSRDMLQAVTVLVVGCPGSFILAGPTAMVAALAAASRLGILIKNSSFLESLADVDTVVLDKTGTVTLGRLELVGTRAFNGYRDEQVLEQAFSCASGSRHPVSRAIVESARSAQSTQSAGIAGKSSDAAEDIKEFSGKGIKATRGGQVKLLGRRQWLVEEGIEVPENPEHAGPIVWLGRIHSSDGKQTAQVIGCFLLADVPRPEAKEAIHKLRSLGVSRSILLTGDRREVADGIGNALEMDQVIAEVLPEQKLDIVREEKKAGNSVMVVGDGVNDALALASGDVGVALGAVASDIALQSADIALMTNDLGRLPMTVQLARRTRATIHQNVLIGTGMSIAFVWLASVGAIGPLVGVVLHHFGELFVLTNSARLLAFGREKGRAS